MKKSVRLLAMLLCVLSITALLPTVAFAAEPATDEVEGVLVKVTEPVKNAKTEANATQKVVVKPGTKGFYMKVTVSLSGVKFQWQIKKYGTSTWKNISGATKSKYTIKKVTTGMNGNRYRCKLSKKGYKTGYSDVIVLRVKK